MPQAALPAAFAGIDWNRAGCAGGTGNVKMAAKGNLTAILSIVTIGAALSLRPGTGRRRGNRERHRGPDRPRAGAAAEEAPDPRPLDRPAGRSGADAAEGKLVQTIRGRPPARCRRPSARRSPPSPRTSRISIWKSPSTTTRPTSAPSRCPRCRRSAGADQPRPEGLDLRGRRPHRRRRRRGLQSGSVRTARRFDQALSGRQIQHRRHRPRDRRLRQEQAEGSRASRWRR